MNELGSYKNLVCKLVLTVLKFYLLTITFLLPDVTTFVNYLMIRSLSSTAKKVILHISYMIHFEVLVILEHFHE
jgi:hypothetical protein